MSMGGLASQAWADAVNALYERGIFIVTAAGNNFGNLPTRYIVYPARFNRVVAACGVMADGRPYADLADPNIMAGSYGPASKMATALAGYSPNTPWAKFGCADIVDHDGDGTSAATPQVAAAAALWIQKYQDTVGSLPRGLDARRSRPQSSLRLRPARLARRLPSALEEACSSQRRSFAAALPGRQRSASSPSIPPASRSCASSPAWARPPDSRQAMLELEALQISQQSARPRTPAARSGKSTRAFAADRQRIIEASS